MVAKFLDLNNLSSKQQRFVLLNDGSEVWATVLLLSAIIPFSITVRVSAKTRLISSNTSTKPVSLGLADLWNISCQNRSPRWPQFCFPRTQNKLAKSTHSSKLTYTFSLPLFKPGSTSGSISTHSLIGNLLQNPLAFSSPHMAGNGKSLIPTTWPTTFRPRRTMRPSYHTGISYHS